MISKTMKVNISAKAEERPVAVLVQIASQFDSQIFFSAESKKINAKSIMGMMSLGLRKGEAITVEANGDDEAAAIENLEKYLCSQN